VVWDSKQLWAGALFILLGIGVYFQASAYPLGDAQHMGPGYFPSRLALVMIFLGVCAIVQRLMRKQPDPIGPLQVLPILFLVIGISAFGLLIDSYGLIVATFVLVAASCYSRLRSKPLEVLAIAIALAVATSILFIYLLHLPLRLY
jgi:putative tricarboxylic transport membrane protein